MSFQFTTEDVRVLAAMSDALAELDGALHLTADSWARDNAVAKRLFGRRAGAAVETVRLRRRALTKLGKRAAGWLLTDQALQQATPAPVAAHRARRLAGLAVHDLTCSIGADLAALAEACGSLLGSDLDPVRIRMARHNVDAPVVLADAVRPVSRTLVPYADPARRTDSGRRILSAATIPSVADLDAAWAHRPPVLRLPPGVDYESLKRPGEVEIVSLDGTAREAVLWPAELGRVRRRASVLSGTDLLYELSDEDPDEIAVRPAGDWLVDPDPAVVRSHLVRQFGFRHGLWQLDPHLAYLSGQRPPPVGRAFRVRASGPFTEKTVTGWLRADDVGALEIKVRGLPVDPDRLRLRLRPALTRGSPVGRTLVLARVGRAAMAYYADALRA